MRVSLIPALLLAALSLSARAEDAPCSAIKAAMAYENVAAIDDVGRATAELAEVDARYAACKARFLPEDRRWIEIRATSAKESLTWPRTLEAAVASILLDSDPQDMAKVAATKREDLIQHHMGWGMGIRNGLGLWRGNQSLLISACGGEPCHPDDASMKIIEAVWEHLQKHPPSRKK
jgi:hypothetical protein